MAKLEKKIEQHEVLLSDGESVKVYATFDAEYYPSQIEEGHGFHDVGDMWLTTLLDVRLECFGENIDVLNQLSDAQKASIVRDIQNNYLPTILNSLEL